MKMIVVHVLPQRVGHGAVAFISVHDCRKDVLLTADNFDCGFVRIGVELFCKLIAAVVEEVRGVDVEDQLSEFLSIRFQTAGGDHAVRAHLLEHLLIPGGWCFEMDVVWRPFRNDVLIDIRRFFALIMRLCVVDVCIFHSCVSCAGTVDTVASCHRQFTS